MSLTPKNVYTYASGLDSNVREYNDGVPDTLCQKQRKVYGHDIFKIHTDIHPVAFPIFSLVISTIIACFLIP